MKLQFEEVKTLEDGRKLIIFRNYLKPNFLNCEVKIALINSQFDYFDFYSNRYGIARYNYITREFNANSWEKEEYVQGLSELSKHYTSINLNSKENSGFALDRIIPDVTENADEDMKELINRIVLESDLSIKDFPFIQIITKG